MENGILSSPFSPEGLGTASRRKVGFREVHYLRRKSSASSRVNSRQQTQLVYRRSRSPRERITARSIKFCTPRMLRGHESHGMAGMFSGGIESPCFPMGRKTLYRKGVKSGGLPSRLSRSEGSKMGKTFRR